MRPFPYTIEPIGEKLRSQVQPVIDESWAGPYLAVNGSLWDTRALPGFAALDEAGQIAGYLLYALHDGLCEIMALESLREGCGIGTQLIERAKDIVRDQHMKNVTVMTTNDNLHALQFYKNRGFTLREVRANFLDISRKLKPGIPLTGAGGIPLCDEIELELTL